MRLNSPESRSSLFCRVRREVKGRIFVVVVASAAPARLSVALLLEHVDGSLSSGCRSRDGSWPRRPPACRRDEVVNDVRTAVGLARAPGALERDEAFVEIVDPLVDRVEFVGKDAPARSASRDEAGRFAARGAPSKADWALRERRGSRTCRARSFRRRALCPGAKVAIARHSCWAHRRRFLCTRPSGASLHALKVNRRNGPVAVRHADAGEEDLDVPSKERSTVCSGQAARSGACVPARSVRRSGRTPDSRGSRDCRRAREKSPSAPRTSA